ncbi:MAG: methionine--tRNA ligase, partial [Carbonactinosporaceae bacterium]
AAADAADARMCALDFQGGIGAVFEFIKQVNGYVTEQEPWQVAKAAADAAGGSAARDRLATILYTAADALRATAVLLNPVMPKACAVLWDSLGAPSDLGTLADQRVQEAGRFGVLPAGARVTRSAVLFPRLEDPA